MTTTTGHPVTERWDAARVIFDASARAFVPTHLKSTYPFSFAAFLSALVLAIWYTPPATPVSAIARGAALAAAILMLTGWLIDDARASKSGYLVAVAMWVGQITYLITIGAGSLQSGDSPPGLGWWGWLAFLLSGMGSLNVSLGVWLFLLDVPHDQRRGGWWIGRR